MNTVSIHPTPISSIPPHSDNLNSLTHYPQESPNDRKRRLARERQRRHRSRLRERSRAESEVSPISKSTHTQSIPHKTTTSYPHSQVVHPCTQSQPSNPPISTPSLPSSHSVPSFSPNFIGLLTPDDTNVPTGIGHLIPPMDVLDDRFSYQLIRSNLSTHNSTVSPNAPAPTPDKIADSDSLVRTPNLSSQDQQFLSSNANTRVTTPVNVSSKSQIKPTVNVCAPLISTTDATVLSSTQTGSLQTMGALQHTVTPGNLQSALSVNHSSASRCDKPIASLHPHHSPDSLNNYPVKDQRGLLDPRNVSQDVRLQTHQFQAAHCQRQQLQQSRQQPEHQDLSHREQQKQPLRLQQPQHMHLSEFQRDQHLHHSQPERHSGTYKTSKVSEPHQHLGPQQLSQYHHRLQHPERSQQELEHQEQQEQHQHHSPLHHYDRCQVSPQQTLPSSHSQAQQFLQYPQSSHYSQYPQRSEHLQQSQDLRGLREQQIPHSHQYFQQIRNSYLSQLLPHPHVRRSQEPHYSHQLTDPQQLQYSRHPLDLQHLHLSSHSHSPQPRQDAQNRQNLQQTPTKQCLQYPLHPLNLHESRDPSNSENVEVLQPTTTAPSLQNVQGSHSVQPSIISQDLQPSQPTRLIHPLQDTKLLPNLQSSQSRKPLKDDVPSPDDQERHLLHRPSLLQQPKTLQDHHNMPHRNSQHLVRPSQHSPNMKVVTITDGASSKECLTEDDIEDSQLADLGDIGSALGSGEAEKGSQETAEGRKRRLARERQRRCRKRLRVDSEGHESCTKDGLNKRAEDMFECYRSKDYERSSAQSKSCDGQRAVLSVQTTSKSGYNSHLSNGVNAAPSGLNRVEGSIGVTQCNLSGTPAKNVSDKPICARMKPISTIPQGGRVHQIVLGKEVEIAKPNKGTQTEEVRKISCEDIAHAKLVDEKGTLDLQEDKLSRKRRLARDRQRRRRSRLKEKKGGSREPENGTPNGGSECGSSRGATLTAMSGETRTNGEGADNYFQNLNGFNQGTGGDLSNDKHKQNNVEGEAIRGINSRVTGESGRQILGWMHWSQAFESEEDAKNTVESALETLQPQFEELGPDGRTYVLQQMFIMCRHSNATNDRPR